MSNAYTLALHKHRLSAWAAATAANNSTACRFDVLLGKRMLEAAAHKMAGEKAKKMPEEVLFLGEKPEVFHFKSQEEFNQWHEKACSALLDNQWLDGLLKDASERKKKDAKTLTRSSFTYGIAAKLINVYLKVYATPVCSKDAHPGFRFIHPPLDALLFQSLRKLKDRNLDFSPEKVNGLPMRSSYPRIPNWTQLEKKHYEEIIATITKFCQQEGMDGLWEIEKYWRGYQ